MQGMAMRPDPAGAQMAGTIQAANRLMAVRPHIDAMSAILSGLGQAIAGRQLDNIINGFVPHSQNPNVDLMRMVLARMFPGQHDQVAPQAAPAMPQMGETKGQEGALGQPGRGGG